MRTQIEVEKRLLELKKKCKETKRRFDKWDNYEDMVEVDVLDREIEALTWVLGK